MSNCGAHKSGHCLVPFAAVSLSSLAARLVVMLLRGYKLLLSPLLPPSCRFTPTCSQYAIEAVQKRGVVHGLWLAVRRLLRCHPFARGGYDPVK